MKFQKTTLVKDKNITRQWHHLDAAGKSLGRLSTEVARLLRGKNKPSFSFHQDLGDYVVVTNVGKMVVALKPKKLVQKTFHRYSGYPGGLRSESLGEKFAKNPSLVLRNAVRGMLPDNRLRKQMLRRLKIVEGDKHNFPTSK